MAGDWIAMRRELASDPAVLAMAERLEVDEDLIVGKLHRVWSWGDQHTRDGRVHGVGVAFVDRYVRLPGFATAMQAVSWLVIDEEGLLFPHFERWNYEPAKQRLLDTRRKQASRARPGSVRHHAGQSADKTRTTEQNRTEQTKKKSSAARLADDEFLKSLKANRAYAHIDVDRELGKMDAWLLAHPGRQKTRGFVVNWLNKDPGPLPPAPAADRIEPLRAAIRQASSAGRFDREAKS